MQSDNTSKHPAVWIMIIAAASVTFDKLTWLEFPVDLIGLAGYFLNAVLFISCFYILACLPLLCTKVGLFILVALALVFGIYIYLFIDLVIVRPAIRLVGTDPPDIFGLWNSEFSSPGDFDADFDLWFARLDEIRMSLVSDTWDGIFASPYLYVSTAFGVVGAWLLAQRRTRGETHTSQLTAQGYGGQQMGNDSREITRLALAGAALLGSEHRQQILDHIEHRGRARAPELGIDIARLKCVCLALENREMGYRATFFILLLLAYIGFTSLPLLALLSLLSIVVLGIVKAYAEEFRILPLFTPEGYDPERVDQMYMGINEANTDQKYDSGINVVVYHDYNPFAAAGLSRERVTFTIDVTRPSEHGSSAQAIEVGRLYQAVVDALTREHPNELEVADCLFVHGQDVKGIPELVGSRFQPNQRVSRAFIERYIGSDDSRIRHYLWVRSNSWGGELVISHFLRFALIGNSLQFEMTQCLMTPASDRFRKADARNKLRFTDWVAWFFGQAIASIVYAVVGTIIAFVKLQEALSEALRGGRDAILNRRITRTRRWNFGAVTSIRAGMASGAFAHYFQRVDDEVREKSLARATFDAVIDHLDQLDIDVRSLREGRTTILNSGILVQGGGVTAQNLAVGEGAQANFVERAARVAGKVASAQKAA